MTRNQGKIMRKVDAIFLISITLTAFVSIGSARASQTETTPQAETHEPTTMPTVAVITEQTTEPTQTAPAETVQPETVQPEPETTVQTEAAPEVILYDVPLSEELQLHIISLCEESHIDPSIVFAMCWCESRYNASTIGDGGDSIGLMQIQPRWHSERMKRLGCNDLLDPFQNVAVGIDYLAEQLDRYDGDIAKALTAYNAGHFKGTVTNYAKSVMQKAEELEKNK